MDAFASAPSESPPDSVSEDACEAEDALSDRSWEIISSGGDESRLSIDSQCRPSLPLESASSSPSSSTLSLSFSLSLSANSPNAVELFAPSDDERLASIARAWEASNVEDVPSDAETHTTDDLFRRAEPHVTCTNPWKQEEETRSPHKRSASDLNHGPTHEDDTRGDAGGDSGDRGRFARVIDRLEAVARTIVVPSRGFIASVALRIRSLAVHVAGSTAQWRASSARLLQKLRATAAALAYSLGLRAATGAILASRMASAARSYAAGALSKVEKITEVHAVRKIQTSSSSLGFLKELDWTKIGLIAGCGILAGALYRAGVANARLATRLAQREGELAELIARIVALQRAITSSRPYTPMLRQMQASCTFIQPL